MTRARCGGGRAGAAVAVIAAVALLAGCGGTAADETPKLADVESIHADWDFVIPLGTGERIDRGEKVRILPPEIRARVGQVIRIENRDGRGHLLGPFYVGAGETLRQMFTAAGTFVGTCTVDPSGEMRLVVES